MSPVHSELSMRIRAEACLRNCRLWAVGRAMVPMIQLFLKLMSCPLPQVARFIGGKVPGSSRRGSR